jgi:hypothetical protein
MAPNLIRLSAVPTIASSGGRGVHPGGAPPQHPRRGVCGRAAARAGVTSCRMNARFRETLRSAARVGSGARLTCRPMRRGPYASNADRCPRQVTSDAAVFALMRWIRPRRRVLRRPAASTRRAGGPNWRTSGPPTFARSIRERATVGKPAAALRTVSPWARRTFLKLSEQFCNGSAAFTAVLECDKPRRSRGAILMRGTGCCFPLRRRGRDA